MEEAYKLMVSSQESLIEKTTSDMTLKNKKFSV